MAGGEPGDRAGGTPAVMSIKMEPDEVEGQFKAMQTLMTMLALFESKHGPAYPDSLGQVRQLEIDWEKWEKYLSFRHEDVVLPFVYLSGLNHESLEATGSDARDTPIVHVPVLVNGQRIAGYWDGSGRIVDEAKFQRQLAVALEAYPEAKLKGFPEPKRIQN